jgi:cell division protein FtsN
MDWIRRNWPDLLIGLALLLVIGGIIATLLNGGNFLPFGRGSNQPATVTSNAGTSTSGETPVAPTNSSGATSTPTDNGVAAVDLNAPPSTEPISIDGEQGTIVAVPPSLDEPTTDTATTAIDEAATDGAAPVDSTTTDTTQTPVAASDVPTAPYRISVGAFGSAENAERKAQSFKDAGYPVFVGKQGDLSLVLIGPYNSQAEAEQVKTKLQSSGLEANPIVYEFQPEGAATEDAGTPDAAPATTETATPSETTTTTSETTTTALPTNGSGRYLQVGAYGSLEAAAPQRSVLEGLGFTVSSVEEGSFTKLLVGPYDDASLSDAQSRLSAQGIDNFVR